MRTTVTLDDNVLAAVKEIAQAQRTTVGAAMTDVLRRGLDPRPRIARDDDGFPVFVVSPGARPFADEATSSPSTGASDVSRARSTSRTRC